MVTRHPLPLHFLVVVAVVEVVDAGEVAVVAGEVVEVVVGGCVVDNIVVVVVAGEVAVVIVGAMSQLGD